MTLIWKHLQEKTILKLTNVKSEQHFFDGRNTKQKRTLLKLLNTKKLKNISPTEHKTEHNYTLVNQAINIHKSRKGVINLKVPDEKD